MFLDRARRQHPAGRVRARDRAPASRKTSCASGSVAAAVVLTADFADGITEIGIGQPGGTLEVGVQRTDGAVTGLSIGGAVRLTQTLTVTLPGAAAAPC
ncbi:MAG: hypothetical protein ACLUNO_11740 [Oscillospiraceae bacterium]